MRPLFRTFGAFLLVVACVAGSAAALEQGERRRAQPRERTPGPSAAAPAPAPSAAQPERTEPPSRGTDRQGRVRAPREYAGGGDRGDSRERPASRAPEPSSTRVEPRRTPGPARQPAVSSAAPENAAAAASSDADEQRQRRAEPRGSRPRGDNPTVGRAVPRDGRSFPRDTRISPRSRGTTRFYASPGRIYNNYYYYYPRRWYPYGYGAFGLGYFYYDPYTWYGYDPYWGRSHTYYYGSSRAYGNYYYDTGELRLQVYPRHAEVYVDGYFAGHVDDFDGTFQALRLEEGPYKIEIVAPGYEPLIFDVRIMPGRKVTYRGELRPRP